MMAEDGLETLKRLRRDLLRRGRLAERPRPHQPVGPAAEHHARTSTSGPTSGRCSSSPACVSPLRKADDTELDWVVVRENSEGEYAGLGGRNLSGRGPGNEVALQTALFTEKGCERIIRFAFDLARTRRVKKVSSVTKCNAQQYGMVLWDEVFARVAADYPDVATESVLVDAMSAKFVLKPEDLSVVVASNLNADILSDLGSALAGSLGLAASANFNPERRFPSMFEPVHGSAPDIAGQGIGQPDRHHPVRRADARALRPDRRGRPRCRRPSTPTTGAGRAHPRHRRHRHHRRGRRRHRSTGPADRACSPA